MKKQKKLNRTNWIIYSFSCNEVS